MIAFITAFSGFINNPTNNKMEDYLSDYYEVTTVGEYTILTTVQYGYVYVLSYDRFARRYNVLSTTNPNIFPKQ